VRDVLSIDEIERVLVITAHPDDVDFGAAGTIATCTAAGASVTYCIVTDGQAGGFDDSIPRADMATIRRAEQTAAAARVGVTDLAFLGHMDGSVEATMELRRDLSRVIRQARPQVVISQSPQINLHSVYASHPDHVAVGQAAFAAVYPDARNPYAFPELLTSGFEPWSADELWIMGSGQLASDPDSRCCTDGGARARVERNECRIGWLGPRTVCRGVLGGRYPLRVVPPCAVVVGCPWSLRCGHDRSSDRRNRPQPDRPCWKRVARRPSS
jgi:LmbE family N-acetylglucosaminyl deacetylase